MDEGTQGGNGDGSGDGAGRVEKRLIRTTQPRKAVNVIWKPGKTWADEENNKTRKYLFSRCQPR